MRHKIKRQGCILILMLLPFLPHAADEETSSDEPAPDVTNEQVSENQATPKEALPRSFTPSQINRISALTEQISKESPNEIELLTFQDTQFLSLYRPAQGNDQQGCIIMLHGNNEHPNWPNVINPIRVSMTKNSWCTLSIEIPDSMNKEALSFIQNKTTAANEEELSTDKTDEDKILLPNEDVIFGRINTSIDFLNQKGVTDISLLGYGTGATYALKYSINNLESGALMLISATMPNKISPYPFATMLANSRQAILDYYIEPNQLDKQYANARLTSMSQRETKTPLYTQIKVTSNSQYAIDEKQLLRRVRGFLKQNTKQSEQLKQLPISQKALFYQTP